FSRDWSSDVCSSDLRRRYVWAWLRVSMIDDRSRSPFNDTLTPTRKPMNPGHTPRVLIDHLDVPDQTVEAWLEGARAGDNDALARLRSWAYLTAREYFASSARRERLVSPQD